VKKYSGPKIKNNMLTQQDECFTEIRGNRKRRSAVFLCECGNRTIADHNAVASGKTQSCGCLKLEPETSGQFKHGKSRGVNGRSRAYSIWTKMNQRCNNSNNPKFPIYGGRGIKICKRWEKFENFLEDMGEPANGLSLDRIDNHGNYEKSNCRWATPKQQANNTRTNVIVKLNGKEMTLKQAAKKAGVKYKLFWKYVRKRNMSIEDAIKKCRGVLS
jgi:hypothetical protein